MGLVKVYGIMLCGIICAVDRYAYDMKHKWKKIKATLENKKFFEEIRDESFIQGESHPLLFREHKAYTIKECVQCGLRRGLCKSMGFFPRHVFYRYLEDMNKLLSVDRIPYTCTPILKELNNDFISIEEFKLD